MKFTLEFNMDNDDFVTPDTASKENEINREAVMRVLKAVASEVGDYWDGYTVKDINGNTVGKWEILPE